MHSNPPETTIFDRFARFYDDDYRDYDDDIGVLLELAEEAHAPVVELGCGTGRVLLPLADSGFTVTGIDLSPALLQVARRKLTAAGLLGQVKLVHADLRAPGLPAESFGLAICTSNTLMHFTTPGEQAQVLAAACDLLAPGGVLFLDLFSPDIARLIEIGGVMELADRWQDLESGAEVLKWSVRTVDLAEQLQDTLFVYEEILPSGETLRTACPFTLRYLWRNEGELMLRAAGFREIEVWGDFDAQPFDAVSDHLIFVARK